MIFSLLLIGFLMQNYAGVLTEAIRDKFITVR